MTNSSVEIRSDDHKFVLPLEGGAAFITYSERDSGELDLQHTEVPREFEGQGVGAQLVKGALEIAQQQGMKVVPSCPFVAHYIQRHPEYQSLVA